MKLYKYRKLNLNTINGLINNQLFFSDPESFNDPFDAKIYYREVKDSEEYNLLLENAETNKIINKDILLEYKNKVNILNSINKNFVPYDIIPAKMKVMNG